jgi:hypothetical protein
MHTATECLLPQGVNPNAVKNISIYIYSCMHAYIHTYIHTYTHTKIHTYIVRTYLRTYVYTCIHIYIYYTLQGSRIYIVYIQNLNKISNYITLHTLLSTVLYKRHTHALCQHKRHVCYRLLGLTKYYVFFISSCCDGWGVGMAAWISVCCECCGLSGLERSDP